MIKLQHPFGNQYTNQIRVLVLGMGESGTAIARWCLSQGAKVIIADTRQKTQLSEIALHFEKAARDLGVTDIHFGQLNSDLLNDIDIVAISPGLSPIAEPIESFIKELEKQKDNVQMLFLTKIFGEAVDWLYDERRGWIMEKTVKDINKIYRDEKYNIQIREEKLLKAMNNFLLNINVYKKNQIILKTGISSKPTPLNSISLLSKLIGNLFFAQKIMIFILSVLTSECFEV